VLQQAAYAEDTAVRQALTDGLPGAQPGGAPGPAPRGPLVQPLLLALAPERRADGWAA
jgi:hypothetical protein